MMYPKPEEFVIDSPNLLVAPINAGSPVDENSKFIRDIYELFSDPLVVGDYPEKALIGIEEAEGWVSAVMINAITKSGQTYFILEKEVNKVIGIIDVIFFNRIGEDRQRVYRSSFQFLEGCCEIEYWLHSDYWNKGIMTAVLHHFTNGLLKAGAVGVVASVLDTNEPSLRVLEKIGYKYVTSLVQNNGKVFVHLGKV